MFDITNNRLANGSCCVPPEVAGTCTTQCTIKLLYCFRPSNYPIANNDCPLLAVVSNTTNAGRTLLFHGAFMVSMHTRLTYVSVVALYGNATSVVYYASGWATATDQS